MYHGKPECKDSYVALLKKMNEFGVARRERQALASSTPAAEQDHKRALELDKQMAALTKESEEIVNTFERCNRNSF